MESDVRPQSGRDALDRAGGDLTGHTFSSAKPDLIHLLDSTATASAR